VRLDAGDHEHDSVSRFGSPIEELLAEALVRRGSLRGLTVTVGDPKPSTGDTLMIVPQFQLEGWRLDFAVVIKIEGLSAVMVVECDGHEYHERTKEQAARDRRRDREIQTLDITPPIVIFRFTGSEIVKDADACADEVVEELERRARTTRRGGE
jgi:very-short-patch-repair endonuclease